VNIQFVDCNGQLIQLLLDLIEVDGEECKSGAYLATLLIQTIKEYNLSTRLGWICCEMTKDTLNWSDTTCLIFYLLVRTVQCIYILVVDTIPQHGARPPPADYGHLRR
jgi:hypothetical protein